MAKTTLISVTLEHEINFIQTFINIKEIPISYVSLKPV